MPTLLLRLGQSLLIVAMLSACGGHWLVLQAVAWTGMIVEYARTAPLAEAVEKTFDGQHPCGLCKQIAAEKGNEQKQDAQLKVVKLEFVFAAAPAVVCPVRTGLQLMVVNDSSKRRAEQPSAPPPRLA